MAMTKQTTVTSTPKWQAPTETIDPYELLPEDIQAFDALVERLYADGKTSGIQYSSTPGVSIRRWADDATVEEYRQFVATTIFAKYGVQENEYTFTVEDI